MIKHYTKTSSLWDRIINTPKTPIDILKKCSNFSHLTFAFKEQVFEVTIHYSESSTFDRVVQTMKFDELEAKFGFSSDIPIEQIFNLMLIDMLNNPSVTDELKYSE